MSLNFPGIHYGLAELTNGIGLAAMFIPLGLVNGRRGETSYRPNWTLRVTSCILLLMKQIAAAKFKEQCLSILDRVGEDGIVITKRGKPVAKLIPIRGESANLIGELKGKLKIKGAVVSTGIKWNAQICLDAESLKR